MKTVAYTCALLMGVSLTTIIVADDNLTFNVNLPQAPEGSYVHKTPTIDDLLADEKIKPQTKSVILKGYDLFMNTQQLRGENVFNNMNCRSCHMGEGGKEYAAPVWPAVTQLPDFRGKNKHVNDIQERIAGCFSFSMNGIPPEYGSDTMVALVAYHQWLAKGAPVYGEQKIAGRGLSDIAKPEEEPSYERGEALYTQHCAICHGDNGEGKFEQDKYVFPALWGDQSYNWGAGMVRMYTLATYLQWNMPLGQPGKLTTQEAWDLAQYIDSQERPQDPRFTGDVKETREKFINFHKHSNYGTVREKDGHLLGENSTLGDKPILKPWNLKPREFKQGSDSLMQKEEAAK